MVRGQAHCSLLTLLGVSAEVTLWTEEVSKRVENDWAMVEHTFNLSTQDAKTGSSL